MSRSRASEEKRAREGAPPPSETRAVSTRVWTKPSLAVYGDLRELTMGPSPDTGESGQPLVLRA
jgi:hypothetical protein